MPDYTMGAAAKAVGVGKATIHRAIASGKLSATRLDDRSYRIDGAELARVFTPKQVPEQSPWLPSDRPVTVPVHRVSPPETRPEHPDAETIELRVRVEMLADQLARERRATEVLEDKLKEAQERRDRSEDRLHQLLLERSTTGATMTTTPTSTTSTSSPAPRGGLLGWLLGR